MLPETRPRNPLSKDRSTALEGAYSQYVDGMTMSALAAKYGVTVQAISKAFKKAGFPARPRGSRPLASSIRRPI